MCSSTIRWCSAANIQISSQYPNFAWNCRQRSANIGIRESMASGVSCAWWDQVVKLHPSLYVPQRYPTSFRTVSKWSNSSKALYTWRDLPLFFRLNPHCNSNSLEGSKFEFSKINPPIKAQQKPSACKACRPNLRCIKSGHKMHHNNGMATSCAHHVSLDPGTPNVDHQQWKPLDSPRLCNRRPPQDSFTKACTVKCRGFIDQENLSFWKALGSSWNKIVGPSES